MIYEEFDPVGIDLEQYKLFKDTLASMGGDVSPYQGWKLAKWANGLMDYYNTERVKAEGYAGELKADYKALKAQKSIEYNEKSVAGGDRQATADKEVLLAKKAHLQAQKFMNYLQGLVDKLEKDFYLLKQRHAEGEREQARSDH